MIASLLKACLKIFLVLLVSLFAVNQAWAEPLTPERTAYQVDETAETVKLNAENAKNQVENAAQGTKNSLKEASENVSEKLNLDEPIPADTKKFFRQIQGKEPIENERVPAVNE
ncbi:MAG: hypothetical protein ACFB4I_04350 [Cyanophyceae cyanobacterium]